ncbi:MAG: hypothetical protein WCH52_06530 [Bacteroidota bacterium]
MSASVNHQSIIITRLTALWALSECALGGMMHALKIPFTGIFVGGLAVICIALISFHAHSVFKEVMKATIIVLMVKAGVSPHTPVPAYIAVSFQGLLGALIFSVSKNFKRSAPFFGFLAITESAIQKFLFTTLIFGKSVWVALDIFVKSVLEDLHLPNNFSFSFWMITAYIIIYAVWGLILGIFISGMPVALDKIKSENIKIEKASVIFNERKNKFKWLSYLLVLSFIVIIFFIDGKINHVIYIVLRSLAVTMLLFVIARPLIVLLINYFGKNKKEELSQVMNLLPKIRSYVAPSFTLAKKSFNGINRYKYFILYLIHFSISDNIDE